MKIRDKLVIKNQLNLIKILTKCAKMTEEGDSIRNGINGANNNNSNVNSIQQLTSNSSNNNIHQNNNNNNTSSNNNITPNSTNHRNNDGNTTSTTTGNLVTHKTNKHKLQTNHNPQHHHHHNDNDTIKATKGIANSAATAIDKQHAAAAAAAGRTNSTEAGSSATTPNTISSSGGRLQFFKDGKFILELARARDGDKMGWVCSTSVPRKTYWPPSGQSATTATVNCHKNESSTSLSFSDDNSSIQSSPWQRDHCWKQTAPRRNISKEMCFYFFRSSHISNISSSENRQKLYLKRRRPYDNTMIENSIGVKIENGIKSSSKKESENNVNNDMVDGKKIKQEVDECTVEENEMKLKTTKPARRNKINNKKLNTYIQKLIDRKLSYSIPVSNPVKPLNYGNVNNYSKLDAHHLQHVSPRKRILRELEKVSLEDSTIMKRSRPKVTVAPISNGTSQTTSCTVTSSASEMNVTKCSNGPISNTSESNSIPTSTSRGISSYSITSLLGHSNSKPQIPTSQQSSQQSIVDPSHLRAMLSSPKSPEYRHPKYGFEKKKSPNYSMNLSPKLTGSSSLYTNHNKSPSTMDSTNFGVARSPGLSPSPEHHQGSYQRFRGHPSTSSSPNYHPYMSSSSSSRCSPSGTISPNSEVYNNRYHRPGYYSPNHNSSYMRQSPNSTYSSKYSNKLISSPTHHLNNLNITVNKIRETTSPSVSPNLEYNRDSLNIPSSSSSSTVTRTVPKKTAALRHSYTNSSPSSASVISDNNKLDMYPYKTSPLSTKDLSENSMVKYEKDDRTTPGINKSSKELDYMSRSNNHHQNLTTSMDDNDPSNLSIRSPHIPQPPMHTHHGMYFLHPSYHNAAGVAQGGPFIPYYHHISPYASVQAAASYRNSMLIPYPSIPPSSRIPMLPYGGHGLDSTAITTTASWGGLPHSLVADPGGMMRIKEDPCPDVPLNLSKH